ncbi:MAG: RNase P subunit p30 family protein [Candidatus Hodarchaeota archaeon]
MPYFESRLRVDLANFNEIKKKVEFCEKLGIKNLIIEPKNGKRSIDLDIKNKIENISSLNIFYRINLTPNSLREFKKDLEHLGDFPYILSVETLNKEIQLQAAKDSRIDILSFSVPEIIKTITPGVISLASQNYTFIEFALAPLLVKNKTIQSKNFRYLYRFVQFMAKLKDNYIICGNFDDIYDLRNPRALISICNTLLGIPLNKAKNGFSENVIKLLKRVELRRNKNVIETGVRIIKGGNQKSEK